MRVACADRNGAARLRSALADHLIDELAPPGFLLSSPSGADGLHVLTDRSGYVLGRARTIDQGLAILAGHLTCFLPPAPGRARFRLRALVGPGEQLSLVVWPLLAVPAMVERKMERTRRRLGDWLVSEIDQVTGQVAQTPIPWVDLAKLDPGPGHQSPHGALRRATGLIAPAMRDAASPTRGQVVHLVSSVAMTGTHEDRLMMAERLSDLDVTLVDVWDQSLLYRSG